MAMQISFFFFFYISTLISHVKSVSIFLSWNFAYGMNISKSFLGKSKANYSLAAVEIDGVASELQ